MTSRPLSNQGARADLTYVIGRPFSVAVVATDDDATAVDLTSVSATTLSGSAPVESFTVTSVAPGKVLLSLSEAQTAGSLGSHWVLSIPGVGAEIGGALRGVARHATLEDGTVSGPDSILVGLRDGDLTLNVRLSSVNFGVSQLLDLEAGLAALEADAAASLATEASTRSAADAALSAAQTALDSRVAALELDPITAAQVANDIQTAIDALVGGAPGALDTLNELAAAIADDANFAASVTTLVGALDTRVSALEAIDNATQAEFDAHTGSTTAHGISAFGATLVDDADAATARATLELGTAATAAASSFAPTASPQFTGLARFTENFGNSAEFRGNGFTRVVFTDATNTVGQRSVAMIVDAGKLSFRPMSDDLQTPGAAVLVFDFVSNTVEVPAPTAAGHASRITAYTAATGRIQRDGVEQGDTGWRDISSLLDSRLVADFCHVKRTGNVTRFVGIAAWTGIDNTSIPMILAFPEGFRWPDRYSSGSTKATFLLWPASTYSISTVSAVAFQNASRLQMSSAAGSIFGTAKFAFDVSWDSSAQAWPTTLPGTQVTAPATLS